MFNPDTNERGLFISLYPDAARTNFLGDRVLYFVQVSDAGPTFMHDLWRASAAAEEVQGIPANMGTRAEVRPGNFDPKVHLAQFVLQIEGDVTIYSLGEIQYASGGPLIRESGGQVVDLATEYGQHKVAATDVAA